MNIIAVICNYNGGEMLLRCVDAVLNSDFSELDIVVVDNASSDGSLNAIVEMFQNRVMILRNNDNLGGAGGFGRGMKYAISKGYDYVLTIDNDAFVFPDTVSQLYSYAKSHDNVGVVGAKIMTLENPKIVFDYAKTIDFDCFLDYGKWNMLPESAETMIDRECDFVAATTALYDTRVLMEIGGMDEDYFIYYDDVDLSYRIKQAGYRVVSLGTAKAIHRSSMAQKPKSTFARYYLNRNRYFFFSKYSESNKLNSLADCILRETFHGLFAPYYKGRMDVFNTTKYVLNDFINGKRGKAEAGRIQEAMEPTNSRLFEFVPNHRNCLIFADKSVSHTYIERYVRLIKNIEPDIMITVIDEDNNTDRNQYDLICHLCGQLQDIETPNKDEVYLDIHNNAMVIDEDFSFFKSLNVTYDIFHDIWKDMVMEAIYRVRQETI